MKLLRCLYKDYPRFAALLEDNKIQFLASDPLDGQIEFARESTTLDQVTLLPPIQPPNILAIGTNYLGHIHETGAPIPDHPLLFIKATSAITACNMPIKLPKMAPNEVDFEGELAVVIGKTASNVSQENALDYVLGYTIANDVTARDCQKKLDRQWARAKSFDTFCPLGPWIETQLDPTNLRITTKLNGQVMQDESTDKLIFNVSFLISYLSQAMTLLPGTVILTGTPDGVGMARNPPVFLKPGDVVEITIDGIGTLHNVVTD
ncbi:MAG: fumarylacetoacetate hydrolase family protein [Lentisphaerae bacterium]|jgi:2-keto-4-pentenoate hydratase/2-oxohepta-3-ene-1,7-dioic acid hydratase in catechol pathway|nr:fumarylacetoacetate hydrolase family protein [Lentisphaerota bacterium]